MSFWENNPYIYGNGTTGNGTTFISQNQNIRENNCLSYIYTFFLKNFILLILVACVVYGFSTLESTKKSLTMDKAKQQRNDRLTV